MLMVTDGLARTICFSEKSLHPSLYAENSAADNEGYAVGGDDDTQRDAALAPINDSHADPSGFNNGFGSAHPTGLNAAFLDGHVAHIPFTITQPCWHALCTRAGRDNGGDF
jgi:prepilin-type processing-associated H-X9-DG protein